MSTELEQLLQELGLEEHLSELLRAGFEDWELLRVMTESQLESLNIPLGHRRRLQREIARSFGWPDSDPLPTADELEQFRRRLQTTAWLVNGNP